MNPKVTKVPGIPSPPAGTDPAMVKYLESLSEALEIRLGRKGDPVDRAITLRELITSGLAKELQANPFDPNNITPQNIGMGNDLVATTIPISATGFTANAAYSQVNLFWDYPRYPNHSQTEIWSHTSDVLGDATLAGVSTGISFVDPIGGGQTRYYWIRHVNSVGIFGPYNSSTGTLATTATDVAHQLNVLSEAITSSELATSLASPIGAIPGLQGQYSVKIDSNGHIAGFGLSNTSTTAGPTSAFIVRADKFAVIDPASTADGLGTTTPTAANVPFFIDSGTTYIKAAAIKDASITSAKIGSVNADTINAGSISGSRIDVGTLNGNRVSANSIDIAGKSIVDSIGRIAGTAGNDVNMSSYSEISQTNFINAAPHHIAAADHSYANVSAGDVMGGSPLFSYTFVTYNFSGTREFIVNVLLDPLGTYGYNSSSGFAFAMRATTSSTAYTSTSASSYVTTRGTSRAGDSAITAYVLSDIVTLSPNTRYYVWVFGAMDDIGQNSQGTRGIRDGQINIMGLNR